MPSEEESGVDTRRRGADDLHDALSCTVVHTLTLTLNPRLCVLVLGSDRTQVWEYVVVLNSLLCFSFFPSCYFFPSS